MHLNQELRRKEQAQAEAEALLMSVIKILASRESTGTMTSPVHCQKALMILDEGIADGSWASDVAPLLGMGPTSLKRWRR
jgi:hypothetical protein